ncbi:MAG TPA: metal ABC transporter ATP-binding protein [Herpetosiphonaceae bacterium]|nr:metal ABC transporter ATP-binding protein [Herpetosiphonaceae bacterium]
MINLNAVSMVYAGHAALRDVSLDIGRGQYLALVGPSGAGKTTLLRLLANLIQPTSGAVRRAAGLQCGYVPQRESVDWNFPITVEQLVLLGIVRQRSPWPWPSKAERGRVAAILDELGIAALARRQLRDISGGQQQRAFLARALVGQPDLLLLDEPTSGLDTATAHDVLHLIGTLHHTGLTTLISIHDLNAAAAHVPMLACLNGRLVAAGTPDEVLTPAVLEETYGVPMRVLREDGQVIVAPLRHDHTYRALLDPA